MVRPDHPPANSPVGVGPLEISLRAGDEVPSREPRCSGLRVGYAYYYVLAGWY